ncbi:hypothetical protein [Nocardia brasiliensis]|uniref:hypothetical protein n=1 Tax=Nocardia brasiliensis TaxID=37326 RepID=UPI001895A5D1|nr:hypothetical protein [Nocardia brasiliensis]MBF6127780.1 hypothetical protein [Nocardia brasiliensis]
MHVSPERAEISSRTVVGPVWALVLFGLGVAMLIAGLSTFDRVPGWAEDHGAVLVYLGLFFWMSIAGRATWTGIDRIVDKLRER